VWSVQLPKLPNTPVVGEDVKLTVPVGVLAPLEAVSVTIAVHVTSPLVTTGEAEQPTLVDVESTVGPAVHSELGSGSML
jgi:hypothetical protein